MVPFWLQWTRRIFLTVLLLCVCRHSVTETAYKQEDNKPSEDVDERPAINGQQRQQQQHVNNNIDKESKSLNSASEEGNSQLTNPKQAQESHDNQQPIRDGKVGEMEAKPAGESHVPSSSSSADRRTPGIVSDENESKARRGWAELPKDEGVPGVRQMEDEDQKSLPNEPTAGGDTFQGTVSQIIEPLDVKRPTEEELNSDEELLIGQVPDSLQEDKVLEAAEGADSQESVTDPGEDSEDTAAVASGILSPTDGEVSDQEGDVDTRTEQINREASAEKLNNQATSQSTNTSNEVEEDSSTQPPKSEDEVSLEVKDPAEAVGLGDTTGVDSGTDPSTKFVEGASQGEVSQEEGVLKDSEAMEALQDAVKEEQSIEDSLEIPKDSDSEVEDVPVSKLDVEKKLGEVRMVDREEKLIDKEAVLEKDIAEQGKAQEPEQVQEEDTVKEDDKTLAPSKKEEEQEMPSFDEWKKKMLEQQEQERQQGQAGQGAVVTPPRPFSLTENSKNHASSDCGAKILNVNKEAQNAPAILQSNRDVYTLNPCTANIWFSVELCEPIQVKHLEIANYELFSSVPKSFRVSISDRFPTREWRQIGTFHAREERSLQSFPVHEEQMFAKYMKVEMLTFFGSEHYCPLSILRVFGTSMVEEIDDENIPEHGLQGETEVLPAHPTQVPEDDNSSLLQSAKGLVRNIMNVITGSGNDKAAPHCENENSSCGVGDKMLPCLPEEEPGALEKENTTLSMMEKSRGSGQCVFKNMFDFSVDNKWFQKECSGSRWCFSPNYGQHFQDCCIKDIYTSSNSVNSFLYCKDSLHLPLYRRWRMQKPLVLGPNLLDSREDKFGDRDAKPNYQRHFDVEVEVTSEKSEKDRPKSSNQAKGDEIPVREGLKPSGASSSKPSIHRHAESQIKPSSSLPGAKAVSATPVPPLKPTCGTLPSDHPEVQTLPPMNIQPTVAQRSDELQGESVTKPIIVEPDVGKETEAAKQEEAEEKPSHEEIRLPVVDKDDEPELEDTVVRTLDEIPTPVEPKAQIDTIVPKDAKTDPINLPDESRKADSTGKDPGKTTTPDETAKNVKAEPVLKVPEIVKPDLPGKGFKQPLEFGGNGAGVGSMGATQKESVFMRLNNRIKSLEFNMSLSSRYLEELSQRYRKQMDEMQKAFNKTIQTLTDNAQKAEEKDQKQQEYITRLEGQMSEVMSSMETTTRRLDSLHREVIERHLFLMFLEILLMCFLFLICIRRLRKERRKLEMTIPSIIKAHDNGARRQSLPTAKSKEARNNNVLPGGRPRRRTVSGGSCDDLLIIGPTLPMKKTNEPARHKPKAKPRHRSTSKSSSTSGLHKNSRSNPPPKQPSQMSPAGLLFRGSVLNRDRASPVLPASPLHRTFSAENLKSRVEEVKGGAPPIRQHSKAGGKNAGKKHGLWMNGRR